jgi:DNA-binding phage protein
MPKTTRFDAADYLDSEDRQAAYISAALESELLRSSAEHQPPRQA